MPDPNRMERALRQIESWSRAYPLSVFPEPDFAKAAELLKAGGMTLDAISASNMRHVITEVGEIARNALKEYRSQAMYQYLFHVTLATAFAVEAESREEAERIIRGICDGGIATVTDSENNQESIKGICDIEGDLELADITAVCNNVLRKPEEK